MAESVRIIGINTISGNQYKKLKVLGNCCITNNVTIGKLTVLGALEGEQTVDVQKLWVYGETEFKNKVTAHKVKITGTASFNKSLKSNKIVVNGTLSVKEKVEAEVFKSKGAFNILTLNAGVIEIIPEGTCEVKEMGAENVTVLRKSNEDYWHVMNLVFPLYRKVKVMDDMLTADLIEADNIYIENTIASIVRGKNVHIGPGCRVEQVEYINSYREDKNAVVQKNFQI